MPTDDQTSKTMRWTGWVMSGLVIAFLLMDSVMKLLPLDIAVEITGQLGYPASVTLVRGLGLVTLACTILYAVPRTSVLGAILLTGY
ncbi:MAG: DoxX family protein, partial [Parvibaculaceae bacterium]